MPRRRRPPRAGALSELPPLRIATQIVVLQVVYYIAAMALLVFSCLAAGQRFSVDLVFGWEGVRGDTTTGWVNGFVLLFVGGFVGPVAMTLLIARSKLVPDFALTMHFLHLLTVTVYTGRVPRNTMWWGVMVASSALATALGIWGCRHRELQPILFGGLVGGESRTAGSSAGLNGSAIGERNTGEEGNLELGYSRGRGRGRGRDGAGEYEMMGMDGDEGRERRLD